MNIRRLAFFIIFLLSSLIGFAQYSQTNITDELNRKQGYWKLFDEMGHLKYEGSFKDNIPFGEFRYYYPDGKIRAISFIFNEGRQSRTKLFHRNKKLMAEGNYLDKKKDSVWSYYSEYDGALLSTENYKNGMKQGLWQKFYPNKIVAEKITYQDDKETGAWLQFYTDGTKKTEGFYVDGKKEGAFIFYHPNGEVEVSGNYLNALKEGVWKYYTNEGKLLKEETYVHGKLESTKAY